MESQDAEPMGIAQLAGLYQCLKGALEPITQKQAESALQEFAKRPGCCLCLIEILKSENAEESPKWLASVHLKNIVCKSWRQRRDQKGLSPMEKEQLRPKLIDLLKLSDRKVVAQLNVVFSKIARFDFPVHWPTLFTDILGLMGPPGALEHRIFFVLQQILKELSTKRLQADQKILHEITKELFTPFWQQWCSDSQEIVTAIETMGGLQRATNDNPIIPTLHRWILLSKAIRQMLVFGYPSDARTLEVSSTVAQALPYILEVLVKLLPKKVQVVTNDFELLVMKGIVKILKAVCTLHETHPWSFCQAEVLIRLLELICTDLTQYSSNNNPLSESIMHYEAHFIWLVLECKLYKGVSSPLAITDRCQTQEERLKTMAQSAQTILEAFFQGGQAQSLVQGTMEKLLRLNVKNLEQWSENPEAFYHEINTVAQTTETARGAVEALFVVLLKSYRQSLSPTVLSALEAVSSRCPVGIIPSHPSDDQTIPEAVLEKEAVYQAVSLAAYDLLDYIDFSAWFNSSLLQEIENKQPKLWPLRRAAAMLLGAWVSKLKNTDRKLAYGSLVGMLSEKDYCIKLTAVDVLRILVDDWAFQEKDFLGYSSATLGHLASMVQESEDLDTQVKVFGLVNLVIERLGDEVQHMAAELVQVLPRVWDRAEGQSLLKIQLSHQP